jgi:hypothetical protein
VSRLAHAPSSNLLFIKVGLAKVSNFAKEEGAGFFFIKKKKV